MTIELAETQEIEEIEETPIEEEVIEVPTPIVEEVIEEPTETISVEDIISGKTPEHGVDKTPKWAKKRFDELTAEKYELQKKIRELEEQKATPLDRPVPPVESDFDDSEGYKKARMKYEDDRDLWRSRQQQTTEQKEKLEREREENAVHFAKQAERIRKKYEDFDEAINEPIFTPVMRDEILASDFGPEIGYFLAKNLDEAFKLSNLSPTRLAKEIGKLEFKFSQATNKLVSGAPKVINPLKGDDVVEKEESKMTDDEWFKHYKQQKIKKVQEK